MSLFDTLQHMADNNMDVKRFDTVHSAKMNGKMGTITMCVAPECIMQLGVMGMSDPTHIPTLFFINAKQMAEVEKLLANK